jgi:hypothetical protein
MNRPTNPVNSINPINRFFGWLAWVGLEMQTRGRLLREWALDEEQGAVPRVSGQILTNTYVVFSRAVEEGVRYGWNRAHKHTSTPDAESVKEEIEQAIMNSVCEFFSFDSPEL